MTPEVNVPAGYDRIAEAWCRNRRERAERRFREKALLDLLLGPLPAGGRVLDVGCGCGVPIASYLVDRGFRVTGLDGSPRLLDLARRAVPGAAFVQGDMRTAEPDGPFDALVAWDSVFHVRRSEHTTLFARFHGWLRPGGRLLVSLGGSAGEFTSAMHGESFFYSGHDPPEALRVIEASGFAIEHWEVDDPSSRGHVGVLAVCLERG